MNALRDSLTPTSGVWRGRAHVLPVRVYYEDTDAAGIVYYANYLRYAERGRTEMMRTIGIEMSRAKEEYGLIFVMYEGNVQYRRPARLDDALNVETTLLSLGAASLRVRQIVRRGDEELVTFNAELACVDDAGKPVRMTAALRGKLQEYVSES